MVTEVHLQCPDCKAYTAVSKWQGNRVDYMECPICGFQCSDAVEFYKIVPAIPKKGE